MESRAAYQRLARSGARVTGKVRRREVEAAVFDPAVKAIISIAHHVKDGAGEGAELRNAVIPAHVLTALLERRNARGPFPFVWLVCSSQDCANAIVLAAPDVLPFSAPMRIELPAAIETCAAWVEGLDGEHPSTSPSSVPSRVNSPRRGPSARRLIVVALSQHGFIV